MIDFNENKRLVYFIYKKKFNKYYYLKDDLMQVGLLALWQATKKFDESKNLRFSSYAGKAIFNAMVNLLRKENKYHLNVELTDDFEWLKINNIDENNLFRKREFTDFEEKICVLYSSGFTMREVANELGKSYQYVQKSIKNLKNKVYIEK